MISRDKIKEAFLTALDAPDRSTALCDSAKTLKDAGATRNDLYYTALDLYDSNLEDCMADLLDVLWGYCSPHAVLFPDRYGDPKDDLKEV